MTEPPSPPATDLFGRPTGPDQLSLFGAGEDRLQAPVQTFTPDPETIRARLNALLDRMRAADEPPFGERDARMWRTVFPNMSRWLPDEEAEQLCFEFVRQMERLRLAA